MEQSVCNLGGFDSNWCVQDTSTLGEANKGKRNPIIILLDVDTITSLKTVHEYRSNIENVVAVHKKTWPMLEAWRAACPSATERERDKKAR